MAGGDSGTSTQIACYLHLAQQARKHAAKKFVQHLDGKIKHPDDDGDSKSAYTPKK